MCLTQIFSQLLRYDDSCRALVSCIFHNSIGTNGAPRGVGVLAIRYKTEESRSHSKFVELGCQQFEVFRIVRTNDGPNRMSEIELSIMANRSVTEFKCPMTCHF